MKRMTGIMALVMALVLLVGCWPVSHAKAAATYTLGDRLTYDTGKTTITWTRSGDSELVNIYLRAIGNGSSEQSLWRVGTTSATSVTTDMCLPGYHYRVSICDLDD